MADTFEGSLTKLGWQRVQSVAGWSGWQRGNTGRYMREGSDQHREFLVLYDAGAQTAEVRVAELDADNTRLGKIETAARRLVVDHDADDDMEFFEAMDALRALLFPKSGARGTGR